MCRARIRRDYRSASSSELYVRELSEFENIAKILLLNKRRQEIIYKIASQKEFFLFKGKLIFLHE